jgi:hypothetical protein
LQPDNAAERKAGQGARPAAITGQPEEAIHCAIYEAAAEDNQYPDHLVDSNFRHPRTKRTDNCATMASEGARRNYLKEARTLVHWIGSLASCPPRPRHPPRFRRQIHHPSIAHDRHLLAQLIDFSSDGYRGPQLQNLVAQRRDAVEPVGRVRQPASVRPVHV